MFGSVGATEILLIFFVALIFFGAKRIPEIARGLGKGIREFKDATRDIARELDVDNTHHAAPARPPVANTAPRSIPQPYEAPSYEQPSVDQPAAQPAPEAPRQS